MYAHGSWSLKYLLLICLTVFAFASNALADMFQGKVFEVWEEQRDLLSGNSYLVLERAGEQSLKLESTQNLKRYEGKTIRVEGEIIGPFLLRVDSVASVLPETRRVVTRIDYRFLTGIFNISGMTTITRTKPEVEEIITGEPTKSLKVLLDFNSYGAINISASSVTNPVSLSLSAPTPGACYPWYSGTFLPAARSAFLAQGFNPDNFERVLYIVPQEVGSACNFAGLAISSKETLYSGNIDTLLAIHELGHNFTMGHASDDPNNDGYPNSTYGDNACAMSFAMAQYNLLHAKKNEWWTDAGGLTLTRSGNGTQIFEISPQDIAPSAAPRPQQIRVDVPLSTRPYYITFRKNSGALNSVYNLDSLRNTNVYIHRYAVPAASTTNTLMVGELLEGLSFQSLSEQILVEYLSQTDLVARIRVTVGVADTDSDGTPDASDTDDDNDGVADSADCAPNNPQRWTMLAYYDPDMDGFPTSATIGSTYTCVGSAPGLPYTLSSGPIDNCPSVFNPDQANTNGSARGDACVSVVTPTPTPTPTSTAAPTPPTTGTPTPTPTTSPTPGSGGATGIYSLERVSTVITKKSIALSMYSLGNAVAPTGYCSSKSPNNRSFSSYKAARGSPTGKLVTFSCKLNSKLKGTFKFKVKSCVPGSSCLERQFSVQKRK